MKKLQVVWFLTLLLLGVQAARQSKASLQESQQSGLKSDVQGLGSGRGAQVPNAGLPKLRLSDHSPTSLLSPLPFTGEFNLLPRRCPTGSLRVGCVYDSQWGQRRWYHQHVPREDRSPMTPEVCFAFCRNVSGAQFFGLTRGDRCYCSPFFHSTGKGGTGGCDLPCVGDTTRMCGGMEMVDMYSMHNCGGAGNSTNVGDMRCDAPPQPAHAVRYSGAAYATTPCRNRRNEPLTTAHASCEIQCEAGYELTSNDIRCVHRGDISRTWAEVVGDATCEPVSCGVPPAAPNSRPQLAAGQAVRFSENVTYQCTAGYTVGGNPGAARTFRATCGAGGFIGVQGCDPVICGTCPVSDGGSTHASPRELDVQVFGDSCHYNCDRGYTLDAQASGAGAFSTSCLANGSFTAQRTCRPVSCGPAPGLGNSTLANSTVNEVVFPQTLQYNCDEGHTVRGVLGGADNFTQQCQASGALSGPAGCNAVNCGSPPTVANASCSAAEVTYPNAARYTCNSGFSTDGFPGGPTNFTVACQPTGFASPRNCTPVTCGTCPTFRLASLSQDVSQSRHFGEQCHYRCSPGYSMDHSAQGHNTFDVSCLETGNFSNAQTCVPVSCGAPTPVEHARSTGTPSDGNIYFPDAATYECVSGYSLDGQSGGPATFSSQCLESGGFSPAQTCRPVSCGPPPQSPQATYNNTPRVFGESVTYRCTVGHTLTGTATGSREAVLQCAANGTYVGPQPECLPVSCGEPQVLPQARVQSHPDGHAVTYNASVEYRCNRGYTTDGRMGGPTNFRVECLETGQFSPAAQCNPVGCGPPPQVAHSTYPQANRTFGEDVVYTCIGGYSTTGVAGGPTAFNVTCEAEGYTRPGECAPVSCGPCPRNSDAFRHAVTEQRADRVYEEQCSYRCEEGYTTTGLTGGPASFNTSCLANGNFSRGPVCSPVSCGQPATPANASPSSPLEQLRFPQAASFDCTRGHSLDGLASGPQRFRLQCLANGSFEIAPRCLPIRCGRPLEVAEASYRSHPRTFDEQVTYTCGTGYTLDGTPSGPREATMTCGSNGTFSGEVPTCRPVACGPPPAAPNADTSDAGPVVFPDAITYQCREGHTLTGRDGGPDHFQRSCQANGTFSWARDCVPIVCGQPPHVSNSSYPQGNVTYPQRVTYTCDAGHTINGQASGDAGFNITCQASGFSPTQQCQKVECGSCQPLPDTDSLNRGPRVYGDRCDYACHPGYTLNSEAAGPTNFSTSCNASGRFTTPPRCMPVNCGGPPRSAAAEITGTTNSSVSYPSSVSYQCHPGHTADGQPGGTAQFTRRCLANGTFSRGQPCVPVSCGEPQPVAHATLHNSGARTYGETVTFSCDRGHTLNGTANSTREATLTCRANGTFTPSPIPTCQPVVCGRPPEVRMGSIQSIHEAEVTYNQTVVYACQLGHTITGSADGAQRFERRCGSGGRFTQAERCQAISCGTAPVVTNSSHSPARELTYGQQVRYTCEEGFSTTATAIGPASFNATCPQSGVIVPGQRCQRIQCGACPGSAGEVQHAALQGNGQTQVYGDVCMYRCEHGFTLNSSASGPRTFNISCGPNGTFFQTRNTCVPVSCGRPGELPNSSLQTEGRLFYTETADYECVAGHTLTGQVGGAATFQRQCMATGDFSPAPAEQCQPILCGEPPAVQGASYGVGPRRFNETVTYTCDSGRSLTGRPDGSREASLRCGADGRFLGTQPQCRPVECGIPPEVESAALEEDRGMELMTATSAPLRYRCHGGCSLQRSDDPWNPAHSTFNISCHGNGSFSATPTCVNIDDCPHRHCGRHGFCEDKANPEGIPDNDFRCVCDPGFEAIRFPNPAHPGGQDQTCVAVDDCPVTDPCGGTNSSGGLRGRCQDGWGTYTCECSNGYERSTLPGLPQNQTCTPVSCGPVPEAENARSSIAIGTSTNVETPAWTYTCRRGHTLSRRAGGGTSFQTSCQPNGAFTRLRRCVPVRCDDIPPEVPNARMVTEVTGRLRFNETIEYRCHRGFKVDGGTGRLFTIRCTARERLSRPASCVRRESRFLQDSAGQPLPMDEPETLARTETRRLRRRPVEPQLGL